MNPSALFCPRPDCPKRGEVGQDNIIVHSRRERRYRCLVCGHTFAATTGTPYFRLRTPEAEVTQILTLLAYGCPPPAITAAFAVDARTVAAWQLRAGTHCATVQRAVVGQNSVDLQHVQADELWVKRCGARRWLAMALAVPSRLWLGAVVSAHRNRELIDDLVRQVRQAARDRGILVCVDGFAAYVQAFRRLFRHREPLGVRGAPCLVFPKGFLLGQVVKSRLQFRVVEVAYRAVCGTAAEIVGRLRATGGGQQIHTAYIERLNATFRSRCAALIRRTRCLGQQDALLTAGVFLVGVVYHFCQPHTSLRRRREVLPEAAPGLASAACLRRRPAPLWEACTPAMAAALTDHCWSVSELLHYRVAPPLWKFLPSDRRRTRPPKLIPWKLRPDRFVRAVHG